MSAPQAPAQRPSPSRVSVRLHSHGVWSVCLDQTPLLLTESEEEAFRAGCETARGEDGAARPLTILTGPSCGVALAASASNGDACA